jgi:hypothetical protein
MSKILIIVPYRDREEHFNIFINECYPILKKCIPNIKILFVEQNVGKLFNRGKILNVGLKENIDKYDSFILHDIDFIPDEKTIMNMYTNNDYDVLRIIIPHSLSCGLICKFKNDVLKRVNGFPNYIWGWGIEDRALYYRCRALKFNISVSQQQFCKFKQLHHKSNARGYVGETKQISDTEDYIFNKASSQEQIEHIQKSGLNNLDYTIIQKKNINDDIEIITVDI